MKINIKDMLFLRKLRSRERTGFCRQKLCWTVENNWSKVIFNEETKVVLGEDKKIYVWRKSTDRYLVNVQECSPRTERSKVLYQLCSGAVYLMMVWGQFHLSMEI